MSIPDAADTKAIAPMPRVVMRKSSAHVGADRAISSAAKVSAAATTVQKGNGSAIHVGSGADPMNEAGPIATNRDVTTIDARRANLAEASI